MAVKTKSHWKDNKNLFEQIVIASVRSLNRVSGTSILNIYQAIVQGCFTLGKNKNLINCKMPHGLIPKDKKASIN
jgi:hypothetical protein